VSAAVHPRITSVEHPDQLRGRRSCDGADLVSCIRLLDALCSSP
jgi:hypothetical protein